MVTASGVIDAISRFRLKSGEHPSTSDVASELNCSTTHVNARVAALIAAGAVVRIGKGPATRLVLTDAAGPVSQLARLLEAIRRRQPHDELEAFALAALEEVSDV